MNIPQFCFLWKIESLILLLKVKLIIILSNKLKWKLMANLLSTFYACLGFSQLKYRQKSNILTAFIKPVKNLTLFICKFWQIVSSCKKAYFLKCDSLIFLLGHWLYTVSCAATLVIFRPLVQTQIVDSKYGKD